MDRHVRCRMGFHVRMFYDTTVVVREPLGPQGDAPGRHYYNTTERHNDRENKILRPRSHPRPLVIRSTYDRSGLNTVVRLQVAVLTSGL